MAEAIAPQYCYGTENSTGERAFLTILGSNDTTSPKRAVGEGLPPSQFSLLGMGTLPVQVFPVPNTAGTLCIGGQVGRFNTLITQADANGLVQIDFDPAVLPATYHAFYDPAAGAPRPSDGRPVYEGLRPDFVWPKGS